LAQVARWLSFRIPHSTYAYIDAKGQTLVAMGKPILVAGVASSAALYGSYNVAKAFVPGAGYVNERSTAALRGAQTVDTLDSDVFEATSSSGLTPMALATGALTLVAVGSSRKTRVSRRATAAAKEVTPPPPPPFDPAKQLGVTAPLGFFDPLGFAKVGDEAGFKFLRAAELKHGRVAMMASVGALVQSMYQFPGYEKIPHGLGAATTSPGQETLIALTVLSGSLELSLWRDDPEKPVAEIGDYGNPFQFGIGEGPLAAGEDMKNRELNNGRAAMIATLGIIVAELVTGKDALHQLGLASETSAAAPAAVAAASAAASVA